MLLKVCVNGFRNAKGTHVSVYVSLLKGEYDSNLDWPFKGVVIVELTNWKNGKDHLSHTIVFNEQTDHVCSSCVTEEYLTDIGWNGSDQLQFNTSQQCPFKRPFLLSQSLSLDMHRLICSDFTTP